MFAMRRGDTAAVAALAVSAVLASSGCSSSEAASDVARTPSAGVHSSRSAMPTPSAAPDEVLVRTLVSSSVDTYGWVRAPAGRILSTYFAPGQRYLGGLLVAPTDEIIVVKTHGSFQHSAPSGSPSKTSLALFFYNASTETRIPFVQMWDGNAPDLGIGAGPGIADRELAAQRWDLRLLGTPTVRVV